jgi:polyisoprenoid-binding protein YceI
MQWNWKHLSLVLVFALILPAVATAETATWKVDPAHSNMAFSVRHFFSQVPGRFNDFAGTIVHDPDNPAASSVEITVQAASINTDNEQRDGHLRSPDFFDVEKFPTLHFKSTKVEPTGDNQMAVTGDLTIHGVTQQVTVPVEFFGSMTTPMGTRAGFQGELTIDRKDYGVSWNRALDTGGAILGDEVKITIGVEAVKQEEPKEEKAAE